MTRAIVIECPICRKRVSMRKAVNHGRNRHADIDLTEYISIIKETKNKGLLRYKQYKTPRAPSHRYLVLMFFSKREMRVEG